MSAASEPIGCAVVPRTDAVVDDRDVLVTSSSGMEREQMTDVGGRVFSPTRAPSGGGCVVMLLDDLDLANEREAAQELDGILAVTSGFVVVDIHGCFVGAQASEMLVARGRALVERGRRFAVVKPPTWWGRVRALLGIEGWLSCFDSVSSALDDLDGPPQ